MLTMLAERAVLVREVGKIKHARGESLQASDREAAMFARMEEECGKLGLNFDYIAELWSTMIYYAKVMECEEVGIDSFLNKAPLPPDVLRANLLALTELTAPQYETYCEGAGANAVSAYRAREMHFLHRSIKNGLSDRTVALDLGCATGQVTEVLEKHFTQVRAFDVSPYMCEEAKRRHTWKPSTSFEVTDLEKGIPAEEGSVDFAVANFGSASEFGSGLLGELRRVLRIGGRAVLSYYNRDALLNYWFYPWPSTVHARLNRHNDTVEVWTDKKVFTVQAHGMTVGELNQELRGNRLQVVSGNIETHPTLQVIVPRFFFSAQRADSQAMVKIAQTIDDHLARGVHRGTYILVEVERV